MSRFVLTAQLQLQAPNNVNQVVQQIQNQLNGVNVNVNVQNAGKAQKQIQQVAQATNQAATAAERMGKAFALSIRRFAAFSIATRAVSLFTSNLGDAIQSAIDFERQLIKVSQVTGKNISELRGLTKQITQLSTGFGVASSDLLEVSTILAQAGLSAEDTAIALKTLAKAALAPNFDSITETAEGAIAVLAQFQEGVGALESQLGSINAVAGAFAVEASDLIDVIRRTGGVFKASGGSLNELLALFTSVRATTRESAESIGTGLRTIFTRIQRPKTIEFLKQFGVELVDLNGKFVGPYEAIKRLSEALSGLGEGDLTFIRIAEELGGFRQIGKVLPLLQQFSTAQSALNVAMKAGDSLTKDAASAQAALAIRVMKVKEEFLALVRSITETPTFQIMANTALNLASAMIKIADSIKPLLPMLAALAAIRITSGIGGFLGGMMKGASSGRTYNKGGKVLGFARGGLVPGSGNSDTVPAMLAPGEFVIRKSSVNKMGAGTLAAMNENRYEKGGRAIVGATTKIKSTQKRDGKYGVNKDVAGTGNIQFDVNQGQIGAFVLTPPKGSEGGYSATQPFPFTLPASNKYARIAASQAGLSSDDIKGGVNAVINPATYPVFYPGMQEGKRNLENNAKYASAAHKGFLDGISTGVNSTINSVVSQGLLDLPPALNTDEKLMSGIVGKIQSDNQVRSTIEGYLFEAMISAFTGATAAGGKANFDFPRSAISQNKDKLGTLFGSQSEINKLIKAEAKRSYGEVGGNIQRKLANDIINGYKGGVTLRTSGQRKHFGGIIRKFATGGGVGTDTVPALLTPGEFVVNRSSAQRIGYGNLNRMNKVGKYARGGVVQHFAAGTTGTGAKSIFSTSSTISSIESFVPGLTKSLNAMAQTANMSAKQQENLAATIEYVINNMQQAGKPVADVAISFQKLKQRVDARTADLEQAKASFAPLSSAQMAESVQTKNRAALKATVGQFAQTDDGKLKSTAQLAFETGQSKEDLAKARKQSLQDAGFVKGSNKQKSLTTKVPEATFIPEETRQEKTARILQQARGGSSQATNAAATAAAAAASAKSAAADTAEAAASKAAENADKAEAASSKGKGKGGGIGGMINDNKMMAVSMGASMLQAFLPAIDETSSGMLKLTHSLLGLVTTIASVGFALESFGMKLTMSNMGSFFKGKAGGSVADFVKTKTMGSGMVSSNMSNLLGNLAGGVTKLLGPLAAAGAAFYVIKEAGNALVESFFGYEEKLKKAKEIGDATNARKIAMEQQDAKKGVNVAAGGAAGAVLGGLLLGPLGAAIGGAIGATLGEALSDTAEYAGDLAAAQAQQVAVQKSLTKASEDATKAMEEFEKGNISVTDVLKSTAAATAAVEQSRANNKKLEASSNANRDSMATAGIRNILTLGGLLGESAGAKEKRINDEQKKMRDETDKAEKEAIRVATPGMNALSKQLAMTGGSFDDLMKKIKETDPNLYNILMRQGTNDLKKSFENIAKEVERTKKSIEAMNLGLRSATATASAVSSSLTRFSGNLEVGGSSFVNDVEFLQQALSSAAQAMNPNEIKSAVGNVSNMLREFGTSDQYIKKFENNMAAFTQAQMNYGKVFDSIRQSMKSEGKVFSADELKKKFGEGLANSLGPDVSKEAKQNLKDVINGIELSPDEVAKVMAGDLSVFGDKLSEAQKKMLEDVQKIAQERAKAEQILIDFTKKRIDAERAYTEAQREAVDLIMEGREIQAKYGGPAVSYQEKRNAIIQKANASNASTGLTAMKSGNIGELRQRNNEIRQGFASIEARRIKEGGMSGKAGVIADEQQKDLQKAQKDQVQTIKDLIKLEEDQLKIIGEKNKLEKESMESLIKGDVEDFFKKQAAVGATAAIASGDERLMNLYGAEAVGTAYQDIQRQQEAGVQELYGQQLAGPGGLTERAAGAALSARGVTDASAARVLAGTTAEEEASKARLRELGGMLGETGQLGAEMAEMQVNTANINIGNAEIKYNDTLARGNAAAAQGKARGGLIYANRGIFVPRGTDTVPAMLTPGEFVVNRGAVQRGNNLQILQAMNNGSASVSTDGGGAAMMARGGIVKYFGVGGGVDGEGQSSGGSMFENMSRFVNALSNFGSELSKNIQALTNLKISFTVEPTSVNINLNDTGGIMAFLKEKYIDDVVIPRVKEKLESAGDGKLKNSGGVLNTTPPR